jgi:hypothetical protein
MRKNAQETTEFVANTTLINGRGFFVYGIGIAKRIINGNRLIPLPFIAIKFSYCCLITTCLPVGVPGHFPGKFGVGGFCIEFCVLYVFPHLMQTHS